jgi:hypothetical protein
MSTREDALIIRGTNHAILHSLQQPASMYSASNTEITRTLYEKLNSSSSVSDPSIMSLIIVRLSRSQLWYWDTSGTRKAEEYGTGGNQG